MKMIGNVSDWLSYAGGALIKVADSAGSTVKQQKISDHRNLTSWTPYPDYILHQMVPLPFT